uniref:Uncharacterized protein n=1 Tax=Chromera velia CCMP2878 TaxID=1169474 RepID=A0A0G4FPG3_9ALVE|eukprot:Cvel_18092.t1-p1 / transcript=Cvel_18092.t1 / gene=Cvel_18092 / organism=Chromera_velia_CCMP2878 / gene_product=hypothetical protein / transcript_product=hypothetical protein / location=Cvel_scaffold1482:4458-6110(-) / protein_length=551 / sequence_SO=supercontig / SO=protein_coding / is_pseudo=false
MEEFQLGVDATVEVSRVQRFPLPLSVQYLSAKVRRTNPWGPYADGTVAQTTQTETHRGGGVQTATDTVAATPPDGQDRGESKGPGEPTRQPPTHPTANTEPQGTERQGVPNPRGPNGGSGEGNASGGQRAATIERILAVSPNRGTLTAAEADNLMQDAYGCTRQTDTPRPSQATFWEKAHRIAVTTTPSGWYALPRRSTGRRFVLGLTKIIQQLRQNTITSDVVMGFLDLLLRRDQRVKGGAQVWQLIEHRLDQWDRGEEGVKALLTEALRLSERATAMRQSPPRKSEEQEKAAGLDETRRFRTMVQGGEIRRGTRGLTGREKGGVLEAGDEFVKKGKTYQVGTVLEEKHPAPTLPHTDGLEFPEDGTLPFLENLLITPCDVVLLARRMQGSAGPSGFDSANLRAALLSYGRESSQLCNEIAKLATDMSNTVMEWRQIRALMGGRLVALDKCPGVRPVGIGLGIGEALRRLIGKAVMTETREDLETLCDVDQLCSGLAGALEGGVYAMRHLWDTLDREAGTNPSKAFGTLLIDDVNAFNAANRTTASGTRV